MSMLITAVPAMGLYLWLTAGSGRILGLWSLAELITGVVLSLFTGWLTVRHVESPLTKKILHPRRWLTGTVYFLAIVRSERLNEIALLT